VAPTYYVIELSPRWLTVLLVALALVMVLAFAFGYGAAWSVLADQGRSPEGMVARAAALPPTPTPTAAPVGTPIPPTPTVRPTLIPPRPTGTPVPTAAPSPRPIADGYWVQVLASSSRQPIQDAAQRLEELGFPRRNQDVASSPVAGGNQLHKLRVGPFPDRGSADRVVRRMRGSGFPDAWVVVP
jgi:cell division septation protein DedD